ncbi:MAG: alpha/beta hydrolase [Lacunisphaera sp.]
MLCFPFSYGSEQPVENASYVQIGGIKQWVTIRGDNRTNPAVLFIHGGPGNPMSLYAERLYQQWEKDLTIVQWDQRGSGRTYEANQPAGELSEEVLNATSLTFEQIVDDGIAVAEHVRKELGLNKLILTGTSWGSAVAVKMACKRPDLFQCYVGLSQVVNYQENLKRSFKLTLGRARELKDEAGAQLLEALGSPPWKNPRNFGKLRKLAKKYEALRCAADLSLTASPVYATERYRAAYAAGEEFSFVKYVGLAGDGMGNSVHLDRECIGFEIPVVLIQGVEDLFTTPDLTKEYFEAIQAPAKELIPVDNCGHDPNQKMLEAQFAAIRKLAR